MEKVGIIGAGSWGTALAWLLSNNGCEVTVFFRDGRRDQDAEGVSRAAG